MAGCAALAMWAFLAPLTRLAQPVPPLLLTALGLAVAVRAVLGYNWLIRRNKDVSERLTNLVADVHGYLVSCARVQPAPVPTPAAAAKPAAR